MPVPAGDGAPAPTDDPDAVASAPLAAALADARPDTTAADRLAWVARVLVYAGVLFAVGGLVYLLFVHEGSTRETRRIVHWIRRAAAVVVGAVALRAVARVAGWHDGSFAALVPPENWWHTFGNQSGIGLTLIAGGALAILFGLRASMEQTSRTVPVGAQPPVDPTGVGTFDEATGLRVDGPSTGGVAEGAVRAEPTHLEVQLTRLRLADSRLALAGAVAVVASFLFFGHTASEGVRPLTALADAVHVGAAATWGAGAVLLAVSLRGARNRPDSVPGAVLVSRFSRLATVALVLVALTGVALSWTILPDVGALWSTAFGRLLLAKVAVVVVIGVLGAHNHLRLVPALESDPLDAAAAVALRRSVVAEAVGFALVVGLTAALVASSPG